MLMKNKELEKIIDVGRVINWRFREILFLSAPTPKTKNRALINSKFLSHYPSENFKY